MSNNTPQSIFEKRISEIAGRTIERNIVPPQGLDETDLRKVDQTNQVTLLALGAFAAVHKRLIAPGLDTVRTTLRKMGNRLPLDFVATDRFNAGEDYQYYDLATRMYRKRAGKDIITEQLQTLATSRSSGGVGLPLNEKIPYISRDELAALIGQSSEGAIARNGDRVRLNGALVTTRPANHLGDIQLLYEADIRSIVEKPMVPTRGTDVVALECMIRSKLDRLPMPCVQAPQRGRRHLIRSRLAGSDALRCRHRVHCKLQGLISFRTAMQ